MAWILLIAFQSATFAIVVESRDDCLQYVKSNLDYWQETGQVPQVYCMPTVEV